MQKRRAIAYLCVQFYGPRSHSTGTPVALFNFDRFNIKNGHVEGPNLPFLTRHACGHCRHRYRGLLSPWLSLVCNPTPPNGVAAVTRLHSRPLAPFLFTAILVFYCWLGGFTTRHVWLRPRQSQLGTAKIRFLLWGLGTRTRGLYNCK